MKEKKAKKKFFKLVALYGYWSDEVKKFNSKLPYDLMYKLNNMVKR